ncbi:hypothetical protein SAMN05216577_101297 [Pseudomonas citronellolis]|uniref:Uncharacterized protein n=1 Tax=Pseudomonas citronellolis TaxID=53408 RepID=A0AAQ1HIJ9_9PSED|nr:MULTISPECIES: DUF6231 family protein [Pseudomonas]MCL6688886.1 DUF6231 family protein [Pseudomonas sp. R3.Fl]MCP1642398.1 hypothetical protein [Pseudomonas citronellolis]MCP1665491.1 hypothetical protein [Pseudomonas citronellolis]MCP1696231.1 hypothetical protein [Pseudomonas citronellolis]MCP1703028.1 hypothetical protein [Pseudomonas citronellolis]
MISDRTPQQALAALLDRYAPQRLLLVGASGIPAVEAFRQAHPDCQVHGAAAGELPAELAAQRYDLALLADCLEHLERRAALQLVGGIRNLNSSRVAVLVDLAEAGVAETDFYALGMQASERFQRDDQTLTLFTYDLREYKQVPDWLNAKFWANPENFGKYWW